MLATKVWKLLFVARGSSLSSTRNIRAFDEGVRISIVFLGSRSFNNCCNAADRSEKCQYET